MRHCISVPLDAYQSTSVQYGGLVTSTETDGKRTFQITPEGEAVAAARMEANGSPWEMGNDDEHHKMRVGIQQLRAAVKQVAMSADPVTLQKAEVIVTEARRKLYQLLAES